MSPSSDNPQVVVALIGAVATIICAAITGWVTTRQSEKNGENQGKTMVRPVPPHFGKQDPLKENAMESALRLPIHLYVLYVVTTGIALTALIGVIWPRPASQIKVIAKHSSTTHQSELFEEKFNIPSDGMLFAVAYAEYSYGNQGGERAWMKAGILVDGGLFATNQQSETKAINQNVTVAVSAVRILKAGDHKILFSTKGAAPQSKSLTVEYYVIGTAD